MRILKYILLLLLLLGVAFIVFVATQQSDYKVVRSKEIKVSKDIVYNFVSDSTALIDWNPWNKNNAVFKNLKLIPNDTILQNITISGMKMNLLYVFKTQKGALITWELKGKLDFELKLLSVLQGGVDNVLGDKLDEGNEGGQAFRDLEWEEKIQKICQNSEIGAQFGGKYFVHDVRVIRLPRHAASCPVGVGVSAVVPTEISKAKITPRRYFPGGAGEKSCTPPCQNRHLTWHQQ